MFVKKQILAWYILIFYTIEKRQENGHEIPPRKTFKLLIRHYASLC